MKSTDSGHAFYCGSFLDGDTYLEVKKKKSPLMILICEEISHQHMPQTLPLRFRTVHVVSQRDEPPRNPIRARIVYLHYLLSYYLPLCCHLTVQWAYWSSFSKLDGYWWFFFFSCVCWSWRVPVSLSTYVAALWSSGKFSLYYLSETFFLSHTVGKGLFNLFALIILYSSPSVVLVPEIIKIQHTA